MLVARDPYSKRRGLGENGPGASGDDWTIRIGSAIQIVAPRSLQVQLRGGVELEPHEATKLSTARAASGEWSLASAWRAGSAANAWPHPDPESWPHSRCFTRSAGGASRRKPQGWELHHRLDLWTTRSDRIGTPTAQHRPGATVTAITTAITTFFFTTSRFSNTGKHKHGTCPGCRRRRR